MYETNNGSFAEGYAIGRDAGNGNNNGQNAWGGDWAWWIVILLIFGWGNGSFGFGNRGAGGPQMNYDLGKLVTTEDLSSAFANSANLNSLNDLRLGQSNLQQTLCQGFGGVNNAITQNGYETRSAITNLGYNLQNCCCDLGSQIQGVNYNLATNTCAITNAMNTNTRDIIDSQRQSTNEILGFLTNEKITSLQQQLTQAQTQLSQANQTNNIVNALRPIPVPSFPASNLYGYANNCGCGCNNTCC